jgi:hypothetical protein
MSDLSALEQSFALSPAILMPLLDESTLLYQPQPASADVQPHEVHFRRLRGASEIGRVLHLRKEIQLPTAAKADAGFAVREKKETKSAWSGVSSGSVNTSVRFASCP